MILNQKIYGVQSTPSLPFFSREKAEGQNGARSFLPLFKKQKLQKGGGGAELNMR